MPYERKLTERRERERKESLPRQIFRSALPAIGELAYGGVGLLTGFNTEEKYYDTAGQTSGSWSGGYYAPSATNTISWLTDVQQGTDGNQRVGNSIRLQSIQYRLNISWDRFSTPVSPRTDYLRFILFTDHENPGAYPQPGDVVQTAAPFVNNITFMSPLNVTNFGRFTILEDKVHAAQFSLANDPTLTGEYFKDVTLPEWHTIWDDSNALPATVANTRRGHLFVMMFYYSMVTGITPIDPSGQFSMTNDYPPLVTLYSRVRFVDN